MSKKKLRPLFCHLGYEAWVQSKADSRHKGFPELASRMIKMPEKTVVPTMKDAVQSMADQSSIWFTSEEELFGFFHQNPYNHQNVHTFGKEKGVFDCVVFTKNSPMGAIFNLEMTKLREQGVIEHVRFWHMQH